jgi:hypothetical protein
MTAIWRNDGTGWSLLAPAGFPNEAALHVLVEQAPHVLPLAGNPRLAILGKEVLLGNGYADLIAVEVSGRLVVIEVKLARNSEARRAVVAQVLTYAAFLRGMDIETLQRDVLGSHLRQRGYATLADAVSTEDDEARYDATTFNEGLARSLSEGRFRLVLVLDQAPDELVQLVGYLGDIAEKVLIDVVAVSSYDIEGSQVLVPQRVDPEYQPTTVAPFMPETQQRGFVAEGSADFAESIRSAKEEHQPILRRLCDWAEELERDGLVRLLTFHTKNGYHTLLPYLRADDAGLVTIWNDQTGGYLQFWRSVFERRAPHSIEAVEHAMNETVRRGNVVRDASDELLEALTAAYREAAMGRLAAAPGSDDTAL